ncbi:DUF1161 domain-containing protein [Kushneria phyllosphaerae]|uniref:DUF1161 domain-containing protein n=1 Tax=Kushneria phyllosphaerae TaxID=2100822 RepID=A0A2R8CPB9_9GAMM|nr:DUF1161 domain-containing protein [Kushneria phyllosphaerae]SPJ34757.1 hypothetical protein KSP9073_02804 [Kushneria phyllosphaerae]
MKYSRPLTGCSTLALTLTALCLPTLAFGACQDVRDRIAQNIESNGVEPMGYSLQVIPTADADQADGQIVGHCESNQYQIVYQRHYRTNSAETMEDTSSDEDEIDGASSPVTENVSPKASDTSPASVEAPETSSPNQTDSDPSSDRRRIETSDMPVNPESSAR